MPSAAAGHQIPASSMCNAPAATTPNGDHYPAGTALAQNVKILMPAAGSTGKPINYYLFFITW
jgi:hypothetical protein